MTSWNSDQQLTWLITGAASGFGLELCRLVLARGHRLIATSRNPAKVPDIVAEIQGHDGRGRWVTLDVDDADSASVIEKLEREGEKIDVLVNNAGWSLHGPAECFTEDEVRRQMETMYFGPYRLIRAVIPHMRSRRKGLILNFGSGAGVNGRDSMGIYAAGKAAMDGLTRVMAKELAPFDIRILTVQLGAFDTSFVNDLAVTKTPYPDDYQDSMTQKVIDSLKDFHPDGDHKKAIKVIYEFAVGEGVGKGMEQERVLVLGRDMWRSWEDATKQMLRASEISKDVCNNVYLDK